MCSASPLCLIVSGDCYTESGEIQSWMLISFTAVPLRHSSIYSILHQMLKASLPKLLQCCAFLPEDPRHAALYVQGQNTARH